MAGASVSTNAPTPQSEKSHPDAELLAAAQTLADPKASRRWDDAIDRLGGTTATTLVGLASQADSAALLIGVDDEHPTEIQLIVGRLRYGLRSLAAEEEARQAELERVAAHLREHQAGLRAIAESLDAAIAKLPPALGAEAEAMLDVEARAKQPAVVDGGRV